MDERSRPPAEIIRVKRDGGRWSDADLAEAVRGMVDGRWGDASLGAWAMAALVQGLDVGETTALTRAMAASGQRLDWRAAGLGERPLLDKHSTGGVGDKVSLLLAPLVAACGGAVPMVSGRGLGHTGGTLDKLEALPGFQVRPDEARLHATLRDAGCVIVGAGPDLAPADARLYAVRDVSGTVESIGLITASILSKKLAAGIDALVLDVKHGDGAFMAGRERAQALAASLVDVARSAGLRAEAVLTPMDFPLGRAVGHATEVAEAIEALKADPQACEPRLRDVTLALAAPLLVLGDLAPGTDAARARLLDAWRDGAAASALARMVAGQGGPADALTDACLPQAPVRRPLPAPRDAVLAALPARAVGLLVAGLGGARRRVGDPVDLRVGLAGLASPGQSLRRGEPWVWLHAADEPGWQAAAAELQRLAVWR